jgi:hypothetical protein
VRRLIDRSTESTFGTGEKSVRLNGLAQLLERFVELPCHNVNLS